ncbi:MAG: hypothetical protein MUP68_17315 [Deltaproteobacteria bacterium]|nr:hypothetical protein [Deltaproteobacteria bacterium]
MSKSKFLIFISMIFAVAVVAWSSGDALAQRKGPKPEAGKQVTRDDVAKYLGKVTPSEQKAAAIRARKLGLKPGIAGRASQAPVAPPAAPVPGPGGAN